MNNLSVYDSCIESGFNIPQSRRLVELFDNQEKSAFRSISMIEDDIRNINNNILILHGDIKEMKASIKMLERMIYGMGALMMGGFGLIVYFIKG